LEQIDSSHRAATAQLSALQSDVARLQQAVGAGSDDASRQANMAKLSQTLGAAQTLQAQLKQLEQVRTLKQQLLADQGNG
jgi:outer membrane murein-binding lipoprotein Lpp